mmetsp:Transcript_3007/g.8689  ORF Transcript_3007/g.8689 Transcript_3007/m.8689 type:complete len:246 (-) Transcript_3007:674-1411(-)
MPSSHTVTAPQTSPPPGASVPLKATPLRQPTSSPLLPASGAQRSPRAPTCPWPPSSSVRGASDPLQDVSPSLLPPTRVANEFSPLQPALPELPFRFFPSWTLPPEPPSRPPPTFFWWPLSASFRFQSSRVPTATYTRHLHVFARRISNAPPIPSAPLLTVRLMIYTFHNNRSHCPLYLSAPRPYPARMDLQGHRLVRSSLPPPGGPSAETTFSLPPPEQNSTMQAVPIVWECLQMRPFAASSCLP